MNSADDTNNRTRHDSLIHEIDDACDRFEAAWKSGQRPGIEEHLQGLKEPTRSRLLYELLVLDLHYRLHRGDAPTPGEYTKQFPRDVEIVNRAFRRGFDLNAEPRSRPSEDDPEQSSSPPSQAVLAASTHDSRKGRPARQAGRTSQSVLTHSPHNSDTQLQSDASSARPLSEPGDGRVFGEYELFEPPLGQGGMGTVYRARQRRADRIVAIKFIRTELLEGQTTEFKSQALQRFRNEAKATGRLEHDNIVTVYDVGETDGQHYFSMQFVDGPSLAKMAAGGPLEPHKAARYMEQVARAVDEAHQAEVLHRDLKPGNVLIETKNDRPLVADFGLAKLTGGAHELTLTGDMIGSPAYMSPEQVGGLGNVDIRTDVYGLGATLYHLLTGQAPFQAASSAEVLHHVTHSQVVPPRRRNPSIDRDLEVICLKCLQKDPSDRYPSARAVADDLGRYLAGESILARPHGVIRKTWRWVRRHPVAAAVSACVLLIVGSALLFGWGASHDRKVARLSQQLDDGLNAKEWSAEHLDQMEEIAAELSEIDTDAGRLARKRVLGRFRGYIQASIDHPRLGPDEVRAIEEAIRQIESRDRQSARQLREELDQRLRRWIELFQLTRPFPGLSNVFSPETIRVGGENLVCVPAADDEPTSLMGTKVVFHGNVEFVGVFAPDSLSGVRRLGLALINDDQDMYEFAVQVANASNSPAASESPDLAASIANGVPVELTIVRNGVPLRIHRDVIRSGPLKITARRDSNVLSLQVNQADPVVFQDVFPLKQTGTLAVIWPPEAEIVSLSARQQALPSLPSPLERGDAQFALGEFSEALAEYRKQQAQAVTAEVRQEALCKEGLCLIELNRWHAATQALSTVAAEPGESWPLLAECHLWRLKLLQKQWEEADLIFEHVAVRYRFEQLAVLLPHSVCNELVESYLLRVRGSSMVTFADRDLEQLERALAVQRMVQGRLNPDDVDRQMRAYRVLGYEDKAIEVAEQMLSQGGQFLWLIENYSWLLRVHGRPESALAEIDRRLFQSPSEFREHYRSLWIERARVHAALDMWTAAEEDVDTYFRLVPMATRVYRNHSSASLLLGSLRERRGDDAGAQEAWRNGLYQVWRRNCAEAEPDHGNERHKLPPPDPIRFGGSNLVKWIVLSGLTHDCSEEKAGSILNWIVDAHPADSPFAAFAGATAVFKKDLIASIVRGMCDTPRGRKIARQTAMQDVSFRRWFLDPMLLFVYELIHQGALPQGLSAEQDALVWQMANDAYSSLVAGDIKAADVLQLAATWKGFTTFPGWSGVAPRLNPQLRGPAAYVFGQRFLELNKPNQALVFFRQAFDGAAPDSLLRRLAEQEVARIAGKETDTVEASP